MFEHDFLFSDSFESPSLSCPLHAVVPAVYWLPMEHCVSLSTCDKWSCLCWWNGYGWEEGSSLWSGPVTLPASSSRAHLLGLCNLSYTQSDLPRHPSIYQSCCFYLARFLYLFSDSQIFFFFFKALSTSFIHLSPQCQPTATSLKYLSCIIVFLFCFVLFCRSTY